MDRSELSSHLGATSWGLQFQTFLFRGRRFRTGADPKSGGACPGTVAPVLGVHRV